MAGMSTQGGPQRFRLQLGVTTGAVEERRMIEATEHLVDSDREYDVYLHQAGGRELVGTRISASSTSGGVDECWFSSALSSLPGERSRRARWMAAPEPST